MPASGRIYNPTDSGTHVYLYMCMNIQVFCFYAESRQLLTSDIDHTRVIISSLYVLHLIHYIIMYCTEMA